jgi:hypothetical protein
VPSIPLEETAKYLNIYWRYSTRDPTDVYQKDTVTFGTTTASYLATKSLKMIVKNCAINKSEI